MFSEVVHHGGNLLFLRGVFAIKTDASLMVHGERGLPKVVGGMKYLATARGRQ
jgi:hypothetical protein